MADIRLVINIDEDMYNLIMSEEYEGNDGASYSARCIKKGTPLPKGHGDLIDRDAIPNSIELKGFLAQDDMHLVTINRVKEALNDAPTIIKAESEE